MWVGPGKTVNIYMYWMESAVFNSFYHHVIEAPNEKWTICVCWIPVINSHWPTKEEVMWIRPRGDLALQQGDFYLSIVLGCTGYDTHTCTCYCTFEYYLHWAAQHWILTQAGKLGQLPVSTKWLTVPGPTADGSTRKRRTLHTPSVQSQLMDDGKGQECSISTPISRKRRTLHTLSAQSQLMDRIAEAIGSISSWRENTAHSFCVKLANGSSAREDWLITIILPSTTNPLVVRCFFFIIIYRLFIITMKGLVVGNSPS